MKLSDKEKIWLKKYKWFLFWLGIWLIYKVVVITGFIEPVIDDVETMDGAFVLIIIYFIFRYNSMEDYLKQMEDEAIKEICEKRNYKVIKNK